MMLLGMVALPSYAQIDPDEVYTLFEWDFSDGQGDFTTYFDWNEMEHWDEPRPTEEAWLYDAENGWMYTRDLGTDYMWWYLNSPQIDITDDAYYDLKLTVEYAIVGIVYYYDNSLGIYDRYAGSNSITVSNGTKSCDYKIPDIVYNTYQREFTDAKLSLDQFIGGNVKITFTQGHDYFNQWYIKKVKVTAKHKYGKQPFTLVRSIKELKQLPENTPVKLINANVVSLSDHGDPGFIRDNTAAIMLRGGTMGWSGTLLNDTIYGLYTKERFLPELKFIRYNANLDEAEYGNALPVTISENEYWDNDCNFVEMNVTNEVYVIDKMGYGEDVEWYQPHLGKANVVGFVYPTEDHRMRFMGTAWGEYLVRVELSEDETNDFTEQDFHNKIGFSVKREFELNQWYTICTPFSYRPKDWMNPECTFAEFVGAEDGNLVFQTVDKIEGRKPYLIKFTKSSTGDTYTATFEGTLSQSNKTPLYSSGGDYNFVGTFSPVQPADGSYYLTANNTIKPLASGGTIKAFRAYFEPATPNAAKARAISIDGVTTAIEDIVGGAELFGLPEKIYTVNGQYVGDDLESLPKGVYIVNGKKIIK